MASRLRQQHQAGATHPPKDPRPEHDALDQLTLQKWFKQPKVMNLFAELAGSGPDAGSSVWGS